MWTERSIGDYDQNGEVNISDITPIAQHWNERISDYSVYCKAPSDLRFTQLASVARPAPDSGGLYRYNFIDQPPRAGSFKYYVV